MTQETIIEKVQKLMALQESAESIGSFEEAANAATKAQQLLMKHNLALEDISNHKPKEQTGIERVSFEDVIPKKNEGTWIHDLYHALAIHNFCRLIISTRSRFNSQNIIRYTYPNLIGTKENITVVKFLADSLESRLRRLEKQAWQSKGLPLGEKRGSFRRSYYQGAVNGIFSQLREAKARAMRESEQVSALVVRHDDKLAKALREMFPKLKAARNERGSNNTTGLVAGYQDGKSISINKGLDNRNHKQLK